jgi:hypothetical protein
VEEHVVVDSGQMTVMKCVIQVLCLQHLKEINMELNSMEQQHFQPLLEEVTGKLKDVENASKLPHKETFLDTMEKNLPLF